jgi:hypothetical protein
VTVARPLTALAVRPARGRGREALLLGFEPPRTTMLAFIPRAPPETMARALRRLTAPDALFTIAGGAGVAGFREALGTARVLSCDPGEVLRFLWFFRDEHDLLSLGHASDRRLLDERFLARTWPDLRSARGRTDVHDLLRETAQMIGVKLPRPDANHRGPAATSAFLEAGLCFVATLLHVFGAPVAGVTSDGGVLRLSDPWLRARTGGD